MAGRHVSIREPAAGPDDSTGPGRVNLLPGDLLARRPGDRSVPSSDAAPPPEGIPPRGRSPVRSWRIVVAIVLLAAVLSRIDWDQFFRVLVDVAPLWLVAVAVVGIVDRCWMAGKWVYLLRRLQVPVRFVEGLWFYLLGGAVGLAAQWQLGGDVSRALGVGRRLGRKTATFASVVIERLSGAAAGGLWATAALGLAAGVGLFAAAEWLIFVPAMVAGVSLLMLVPFWNPRMRGVARRVVTRIPFLASFVEYLRSGDAPFPIVSRRGMVGFFLLTLAEQSMPVVSAGFLIRAFHLDVALFELIMVVPIIVFFSRLPISVESIGVKEGLFVLVFGTLGVSPEAALAMALTGRILDAVVVGTGLLVGSAAQRVSAAEPLAGSAAFVSARPTGDATGSPGAPAGEGETGTAGPERPVEGVEALGVESPRGRLRCGLRPRSELISVSRTETSRAGGRLGYGLAFAAGVVACAVTAFLVLLVGRGDRTVLLAALACAGTAASLTHFWPHRVREWAVGVPSLFLVYLCAVGVAYLMNELTYFRPFLEAGALLGASVGGTMLARRTRRLTRRWVPRLQPTDGEDGDTEAASTPRGR